MGINIPEVERQAIRRASLSPLMWQHAIVASLMPVRVFSLVTTRAPIFFARSQSAALLMLASGAIVATSVPFRLRMLSMDIASSHRVG
jgi:hypothetical protein